MVHEKFLMKWGKKSDTKMARNGEKKEGKIKAASLV